MKLSETARYLESLRATGAHVRFTHFRLPVDINNVDSFADVWNAYPALPTLQKALDATAGIVDKPAPRGGCTRVDVWNAERDPKTDPPDRQAWAFCSVRDVFNHKIGMAVALGRLRDGG